MDKESILEIICDLYEELEISEFGFDLKQVCNKLGINLIPYSLFENQNFLLKYDEDGFNCINPINNKIEIYYNDSIIPKQRINFTIPHEIGHIALNHNCTFQNETAQQNKEANIFAREFYCPEAFIIHYNLNSISDLMSSFNITRGYTEVLIDKVRKRSKELSLLEKRLIKIFEENKNKKAK